MNYIHEVDLKSRKTNESIVCIYSGDDYDKAEELCETFNKSLPDYNPKLCNGEYYDRKSDGLYAYHFIIDNDVVSVHGVGNYFTKEKNVTVDKLDYYEKVLKSRIDANKSLLNAWKDRINTELVNFFNDDCFEKNVIDMLLYISEIKKRNKELEMCLALYQVGKNSK